MTDSLGASVAIGFALIGSGLGSRAWGLTLAGAGLFYGLFGVFRLGVFIDIALVAGTVALAVAVLKFISEPPSRGALE